MTDIAEAATHEFEAQKRLRDQGEEYRQKVQLGRALDSADEATTRGRIELLARLIFAEAANHYKTSGAMEGIGWAVINRIGRPGFQKTFEEVVFKPSQFAVGNKLWKEAAEPSKLTADNAAAYAKAKDVAAGILGGRIPDPTEGPPYFYSSPDGSVPGTWFPEQLRKNTLERSPKDPVGEFHFLRPRIPMPPTPRPEEW